jgi:organic radical activating enzyme
MNTQKPEKPLTDDRIWLHSFFNTIQGEGPFTGMPALFVRLAGCNLQCPQCDTEYTKGRQAIAPARLAEHLGLFESPANALVVITGGEPCRQSALPALVSEILARSDCIVQLETNGTLPLPHTAADPWGDERVHIVCSPKTGKVHPSIRTSPRVTYKYVGRAGELAADDGLPIRALEHPASPRLARPHAWAKPHEIWLNPLDEGDAKANHANLRAVKESCLKHGYRLGIQLHKLIGVE